MSCEALIKLSLKSLPGINQSSIDGKTKTVTIEYDEKEVSKDKIAKHIQEFTGYKVSYTEPLWKSEKNDDFQTSKLC